MLSLEERPRADERKHHASPIFIVATLDRISQIG
jgi:hypothetical protein